MIDILEKLSRMPGLSLLATQLPDGEVYGMLAEFENPQVLYTACKEIRDAGFSKWDAHTPFPVHGLESAMGIKASPLPWMVLGLGMAGAATGFAMQTWIATEGYPLVISGKPLFSWPAFIPVTFELGVLGGALAAVFGMFALCRLPTLHHPLFNSERFERFSNDRFFISIEAGDPLFDADGTAEMLKGLGATAVETIANSSRHA